jgi:hypothetical protein
MSDAKMGEVRGECPQCYQTVWVYLRGGKLRVRTHTKQVSKGWRGSKTVACPVRDLDGRAAIDRRAADLLSAETEAAKRTVKTREQLATDEALQAKATAAREAYAAKVAALTGVAPTAKPAGEP